jgi:deoxyribose-phosphate aldolase
MIAPPGSSREVSALIDHTLLKPEATRKDIERLCNDGLQHQFASVCVNPIFTDQVAQALRGSAVKTCVVVGFPLGANLPATKIHEARVALDQGAQEIDMVISIGALKAGLSAAVGSEIALLTAAIHERRAILKVIIETALLSDDEKIRVCGLARDAGADFVKTSTGFSTAGATASDVALMRRVVGPKIGVKASGGVRTLDDLLKMVDAGASRIGTSNGVSIVQEAKTRFGD